MAICCPMTTKIKGYVFEVVISDRPPSAILADQIRSSIGVLVGLSARELWSRESSLKFGPR